MVSAVGLSLWLASWLSFVVSAVGLSLSHWYPGSGVVLDCINPYLCCFLYFERLKMLNFKVSIK